MDRRSFIRHSASGAAGLTIASSIPSTVLGANDRLRLGLIGCGSRGNFLLQQALRHREHFNLEFTALCDVWSKNLHTTVASLAQGQSVKPRLFAPYEELLEMSDLDAVIMATPDFAHTPMLIAATKRRKDAFVEKPMATVLVHANRGGASRARIGGPDALKTPMVVSSQEAITSTAPAATGLAATQNDARFTGDVHMTNWLECLRSRATPNASVDVGYAHTVASIMAFQAWNTGRRQVFDRTTRRIRSA